MFADGSSKVFPEGALDLFAARASRAFERVEATENCKGWAMFANFIKINILSKTLGGRYFERGRFLGT